MNKHLETDTHDFEDESEGKRLSELREAFCMLVVEDYLRALSNPRHIIMENDNE